MKRMIQSLQVIFLFCVFRVSAQTESLVVPGEYSNTGANTSDNAPLGAANQHLQQDFAGSLLTASRTGVGRRGHCNWVSHRKRRIRSSRANSFRLLNLDGCGEFFAGEHEFDAGRQRVGHDIGAFGRVDHFKRAISRRIRRESLRHDTTFPALHLYGRRFAD